jgi:hypothetical protein
MTRSAMSESADDRLAPVNAFDLSLGPGDGILCRGSRDRLGEHVGDDKRGGYLLTTVIPWRWPAV